MAKKATTKTGAKAAEKPVAKAPALKQMTTVSFRTRRVLKQKAEAVFEDMGISTSAAINMFLTQVVREKGMPFQPNAKKSEAVPTVGAKSVDDMDSAGYIALEELWNEM